jgi:hypothetical protein
MTAHILPLCYIVYVLYWLLQAYYTVYIYSELGLWPAYLPVTIVHTEPDIFNPLKPNGKYAPLSLTINKS